MDNTYSVKEVADILSISTRAVTMRCKKHGLKKKGKSYLIDKELLNEWSNTSANEQSQGSIKKQKEDKEVNHKEAKRSTSDNIEEGTITETFTPEKYKELERVITNYYEQEERTKILKNEILLLQQQLDRREIEVNNYKKDTDHLTQRLNDSKEQIEYFRGVLAKTLDSLDGTVKNISQGNYIAAKDKGYE